jgi:hypothetical protein
MRLIGIASLDGRTCRPDASVTEAKRAMKPDDRGELLRPQPRRSGDPASSGSNIHIMQPGQFGDREASSRDMQHVDHGRRQRIDMRHAKPPGDEQAEPFGQGIDTFGGPT